MNYPHYHQGDIQDSEYLCRKFELVFPYELQGEQDTKISIDGFLSHENLAHGLKFARAAYLADEVAAIIDVPPNGMIIDLFSGIGSHAMAFGRAGFKVQSIDINDFSLNFLTTWRSQTELPGEILRPLKLDLENDYERLSDLLEHLRIWPDLIFLDPPWGPYHTINVGQQEGCKDNDIFDLRPILELCKQQKWPVAVTLPKEIDAWDMQTTFNKFNPAGFQMEIIKLERNARNPNPDNEDNLTAFHVAFIGCLPRMKPELVNTPWPVGIPTCLLPYPTT